jgi:hypothetical protein
VEEKQKPIWCSGSREISRRRRRRRRRSRSDGLQRPFTISQNALVPTMERSRWRRVAGKKKETKERKWKKKRSRIKENGGSGWRRGGGKKKEKKKINWKKKKGNGLRCGRLAVHLKFLIFNRRFTIRER